MKWATDLFLALPSTSNDCILFSSDYISKNQDKLAVFHSGHASHMLIHSLNLKIYHINVCKSTGYASVVYQCYALMQWPEGHTGIIAQWQWFALVIQRKQPLWDRMNSFSYSKPTFSANSSVPVLPLCAHHSTKSLSVFKFLSHVHLKKKANKAFRLMLSSQYFHGFSSLKQVFQPNLKVAAIYLLSLQIHAFDRGSLPFLF